MTTEVNEVMPGQTSELLKPAIHRQKERKKTKQEKERKKGSRKIKSSQLIFRFTPSTPV